jgi:hypothetical protein
VVVKVSNLHFDVLGFGVVVWFNLFLFQQILVHFGHQVHIDYVDLVKADLDSRIDVHEVLDTFSENISFFNSKPPSEVFELAKDKKLMNFRNCLEVKFFFH